MTETKKNGDTLKALWGMILVAVIALVAMQKEVNGEITTIAIYAVVALALGIQVIEWYLNRKV